MFGDYSEGLQQNDWIAEWLLHLEILERSGRPRRISPVIRAAPRVGDLYWCKFPDREAVELPEIWKTRPVVVVSRRNTLRGKVTVRPFSTSPGNHHDMMALPVSAKVLQAVSSKPSWILCDHPCTVATSRLRQIKGKVPKLAPRELSDMLKLMISAMASPSAELDTP